MRGGVIIADPRNSDVFGHHGLAFFLELFPEDFLKGREADAHHVKAGADCQCVLRDFISGDVNQLGNGERAELHAVSDGARLDGVRIVDARGTGREQRQVTIHSVLVERNEQVDAVTHVGDAFRARTNC